MAFGFDTDSLRPKLIEVYSPEWKNRTESYTCRTDFFNYTLDPNYAWCFKNVTTYHLNISNGSYLETLFEGEFDYGNLTEKTVYWNVSYLDEWADYSSSFDSINYSYESTDRWWFNRNIPIVQDQEYVFRVRVQATSWTTMKRKYWFAIKPSAQTLQEAIGNGTFYALDPWVIGLNDQLVMYWKLNESSGDALDSYTGVFNGTVTGATQGETACVIGECYSFDGTDDEVVSIANETLTNKDFSVSFWANATDGTAELFVQLGWHSGAATANYIRISGDSYNIGYSGANKDFGDASGDYGEWHHHVIVYKESTTNFTWYKDGAFIGDDVARDQNIDDSPIILGTDSQAGTDLNGFMDEVGLWNRTLTASEVSDLYNSGNGITFEEVGFPTWSNNLTNSTQAGTNVLFSVLWQDDTDLSSFVFAWFNGTNWTLDSNTSDLESGTQSFKANITSGSAGQDQGLYEDCADISEWTLDPAGGWASSQGSCASVASDDNMTNISDTSGYDLANVSFTLDTNKLDGGEYFRLYASTDGSYTEILTVEDDNNGPLAYEIDITDYISSTTYLRFACLNADGGESCLVDNINITLYTSGGSGTDEQDVNRTGVLYENIAIALYESIDNFTVYVNVSEYNNSGSEENQNNNVSLWLYVWNSSDWVDEGDFSVTAPGIYSQVVTTASVVSAWPTLANRDLNITAVALDSNVTTGFNDTISFDVVNITMNSQQEFLNDSIQTFSGVINNSNVTQGISTTVGDTIRWFVWANDSSNNANTTDIFEFTTTAGDTEYPVFSSYWDNNATLVATGTALFNVTLLSTNGTVFLEIDGSNYTAENITANVYNASVVLTTGTYAYYWGSWGNGSEENYNTSVIRYYTVNASALESRNITEYFDFASGHYDLQGLIRRLAITAILDSFIDLTLTLTTNIFQLIDVNTFANRMITLTTSVFQLVSFFTFIDNIQTSSVAVFNIIGFVFVVSKAASLREEIYDDINIDTFVDNIRGFRISIFQTIDINIFLSRIQRITLNIFQIINLDSFIERTRGIFVSVFQVIEITDEVDNPGYCFDLTEEIFSDNFTSALTNWTEVGSGGWDIVGGEGHYDGSPGSRYGNITLDALNLSDYSSVDLFIQYRENDNLEADDCLSYTFSNSSSESGITDIFCNDNSSTFVNFTVTVPEEWMSESFQFKLLGDTEFGEDIYVDNLNITGCIPFANENTSLEFYQITPYCMNVTQDIVFNVTCEDADSDDTITAYLRLWNNSDQHGGVISQTVNNGTNTAIYTLDAGNTSESDEWIGEFWCGDGVYNTSSENETITVQPTVYTEEFDVQTIADYFKTDSTIEKSYTGTQYICLGNTWGTPTAAIAFHTSAIFGNPNHHIGRLGIGFSDGENNTHTWMHMHDEDGEEAGFTIMHGRASTDSFLWFARQAGSEVSRANATFEQDRIRLDWTNAASPASKFSISLMVFKGTENVSIGTHTHDYAIDGENSSQHTGFTPDILFMSTTGNSFNNAVEEASTSFGVAVNNGSIGQHSFSYFSRDNVATTSVGQYLGSGRVIQVVNDTTAASRNSLTINNINTTGFQTFTYSGASMNYTHFLAIGLPGGAGNQIIPYSGRSGVGVQTLSGFGFEPEAVLGVHTLLAARNTLYFNQAGSTEYGTLTIGMAENNTNNEATNYFQSFSEDDDVTLQAAFSIQGDGFYNVSDEDGTPGNEAYLIGFTSDGLTLNWTVVNFGAKPGWILGFRGSSPQTNYTENITEVINITTEYDDIATRSSDISLLIIFTDAVDRFNGFFGEVAQSINMFFVVDTLSNRFLSIFGYININQVVSTLKESYQNVLLSINIDTFVERTYGFVRLIYDIININSFVDRIFQGTIRIFQVIVFDNVVESTSSVIPTIDLDLITPPNLNNMNASQYEFFNITVNVTCRRNNCGVINVTFDPWDTGLSYGLENYWKLNETEGTVNDSLGVLNGTNYGNVLRGTAGIIGNAFNYTEHTASGLNYTNLGNNSAIGTDNNPFSVSAWVKFNCLGCLPVGNADILNRWKNHSEGYNLWSLYNIQFTTKRFAFVVPNASGDTPGGAAETSFAAAAGQWYHVVGVFNGTDELIYVNGSLEGTSTFVGTMSTESSVNLTIGGSPEIPEDTTDGVIDEVGIWNRALTASEIEQLYNNHAGVTYDPDASKGTISTIVGATPFYTNATNNPVNITLDQDESQVVTIYVNATGVIWDNYTFFVYANRTADFSHSNITGTWNVTIIAGSEHTDIDIFEEINITSYVNRLADLSRDIVQFISFSFVVDRITDLNLGIFDSIDMIFSVDRITNLFTDVFQIININTFIERARSTITSPFQVIDLFFNTDRDRSVETAIFDEIDITTDVTILIEAVRDVFQIIVFNNIIYGLEAVQNVARSIFDYIDINTSGISRIYTSFRSIINLIIFSFFAVGEGEDFQNVSIIGEGFTPSSRTISSVSYQEAYNLTLNTTGMREIHMVSTFTAERTSGGTVNLYGQVRNNGNIICQETLIRKITSADIGAVIFKCSNETVNTSESIFLDYRLNGGGAVLIDNTQLALFEPELSNGFNITIWNSIENKTTVSHSSQNFIPLYNFSIDLDRESDIYIDFSATVSRTATITDGHYFISHLNNGVNSSKSIRSFPGALDIGSMGVAHVFRGQTGQNNFTIYANSTNGVNLDVEPHIIAVEMRNESDLVQNFNYTNESTIENPITLSADTEYIMHDFNHTLRGGNALFIQYYSSIENIDSVANTSVFTINITNSTGSNVCSAYSMRAFSIGDIGSIPISVYCSDLVIDEDYRIQSFIIPGFDANITDESISGFESLELGSRITQSFFEKIMQVIDMIFSVNRLADLFRDVSQIININTFITRVGESVADIRQVITIDSFVDRAREATRNIFDVFSIDSFVDRLLDLFRTVTQRINIFSRGSTPFDIVIPSNVSIISPNTGEVPHIILNETQVFG